MTVDEFKEKMRDKPNNSDKYRMFFDKEIKGHLSGYWDPTDHTFTHLNRFSEIRLVGGNNASFCRNG